MSTQKKTCPKCSSVMDYRLGVYDCPQCGHQEAKQIEIDPRERRASGPGFKREQPWDKAQSSMHAPGAAPPPPMGTVYQPGAPMSSQEQLYGVAQEYVDPLDKEKWIYFWITVGFYALSLLLGLIGAFTPGEGSGIGEFIGSVIGSAIGLAVLHWVFFSDTMWAKRACFGCSVIGLIVGALSFFSVIVMLNQHTAEGIFSQAEFGFINLFIWLYFLFTFAWELWFVSILWRDIQNYQQSGR